MRLFTVGPVEMFDEIKAVRGGGVQVSRTSVQKNFLT